MKPTKPSESFRSENARGAVFLEFMLVFGTLVLLFLFFLDLMHYMAARSTLTKGAQDALNLAIAHEDIQLDLSSFTVGSPEHNRYVEALNEVLAEASRLPLNSMISHPDTNPNGLVTIKPYRISTNVGGGSWDSAEYSAVVMRPGDGAKFRDNTTPDTDFDHPDSLEGEGMDKALKSKPLIITMTAEKKMFTPFMSSIPIQVAAVGWVQQFPKAGFDVSEATGELDPDDPDGGVCDAPDWCTAWNADLCVCCSGDSSSCLRGTTWSEDLCGCDCSVATVDCNESAIEYAGTNGYDCQCLYCPSGCTWMPDDGICSCPDGSVGTPGT